jgi:ribosome-associated translation inhibitor RaiA
LRKYIERRLDFTLGRFAERVGRVRVKISGLNGSRGGTTASCRISADLSPSGRVALQETDIDLYAAIDSAVNRVGRLLSQRLERLRESKEDTDIVPAA